MKKTNYASILAVALALILCFASLAGCEQSAGGGSPAGNSVGSQLASGGVLRLKVNPEIAISYDADGLVTGVDSRNEDAKDILANYTGFEGKECRQVVSELVAAIGEAGYFVEEVEGERRQITIEIESGSSLPSKSFLDDVVAEVRTTVSSNNWTSPVEVQGESDYGITEYVDTDYGPGNDGVTDYDHTDYGPNNDGVTDYSAVIGTDGSVTVTGGTDYDDSDYGPNNDGVTDYDNSINDESDYGPNSDGVTDYDDQDGTDYGPNGDGDTDYNDTDYGVYGDGVTDYNDTDYGVNNDGVTDYSDGGSNYSDGSSDYSSGNSNYGDGGSNYSDSGYDD